MKLIKLLGLAVIAGLAALAFVGTLSAPGFAHFNSAQPTGNEQSNGIQMAVLMAFAMFSIGVLIRVKTSPRRGFAKSGNAESELLNKSTLLLVAVAHSRNDDQCDRKPNEKSHLTIRPA